MHHHDADASACIALALALRQPPPAVVRPSRPITIPRGMFFPPPVQSPPLIPAGYGHHVNPPFAPMFGPACVGRA